MNPSASVLFSHSFLAAVLAVSQIVTFAQSPIEDFSKEKVGMAGQSSRHRLAFLLGQQSGVRPCFATFFLFDEVIASRQILNGRVSEWASRIVCLSAKLGPYVCGTSLRH